jgi:hypothetical protein
MRGRTRFALVLACILAAGAVQLLVISHTADYFAHKSEAVAPARIAARISSGARPMKDVGVQGKRTHPPAHEFVPVAAVPSTRIIRSIL